MGDGATTEPSSFGQGMLRRIWPWPWAAESSFRFCPQVSSRVCCLWASLTLKSLPLSQAHRLPGAAREQLPRTTEGNGAQRRRKNADAARGAHPRPRHGSPAAARDPRASNQGSRPPAPGPARKHRGRAPGPRTLTRPRRRRRLTAARGSRGRRRSGGAAAPQRRSLGAPLPALRPPPAPRAALPGPAPGPGRPRAVTPPGGAARRARLGAQREAGSRTRFGTELGAAFHKPGSLPGRREAPRRSPTTHVASGARGRGGSPRPGRKEFQPPSEPPSPRRESSGLPLRSSPCLTVMGPGG